MSFEKTLDLDSQNTEFGSAPYLKNYKERQNVSKVDLDSDKGCRYLDDGEVYTGTYSATAPEYVAATNLTYDLFFSLFDVNTTAMFVTRYYRFDPKLPEKVRAWLAKVPQPANIEARVIGMQSGELKIPIERAIIYMRKTRFHLMEIDLFGSDTRHVAIEAKRGVTFDVLMESRPYKPGELKNTMTAEQFERTLRPLAPPPMEVKGKPKRTSSWQRI